MSDKPSGTSSKHALSRRKMLALTSGAAAAGLAGCSGGGDQTTTTPGGDTTTTADGSTTTGTNSTTQSNAELVDSSPTHIVASLPDEINFNRYARSIEFSNWQWEYLRPTYFTGDHYNWLLEDFGYDPKTRELTYKFKENFYWHDGTQVTAEDYYNQQEIARLMDPEGSDIEEHRLEDDFTMVSVRKEALNPILVGVEEGRLWTRRDRNTEWVEKYQDASNQKQRDEVTAELTKSKVGIQEFADEGLANSLWKLTEWNEQEYTFEKFEKHPFADETDFDQMNFKVAKGGAKDQRIVKDEIDFGAGLFNPDLRSAAPDHLKTMIKARGIRSKTLVWNYKNNDHIARRGVRRAITAALDLPKLAEHLDGELIHEYQSGLPSNLENKWLGSDFLNNLIPYSMGPDEEQATQFLEMEGYTMEGGNWVDENGNPIEFTYTSQTSSAYATFANDLAQQLGRFGMNVNVQTMESTTWYKDFLNANKWDMTFFGHGWGSNEPLNFYNYNNHYKMRLGTGGGQIKKWLDDGKTKSELNGKPLVITLPQNVGDLQVSGDGRKVNLYQTIEDLKVAQSEEKTREIVKTLAWYFNYDLPLIDVWSNQLSFWADSKNFEYPEKSNPVYYQKFGGYHKQLRRGMIKGVPKQ